MDPIVFEDGGTLKCHSSLIRGSPQNPAWHIQYYLVHIKEKTINDGTNQSLWVAPRILNLHDAVEAI